ncbi:MAG: creatininase family protein [Candidatus Binatia bacterium]|nr:creatininase family protein [Candidatus Binatia bacterium]
MAVIRGEELTYTKLQALDFGRTICFQSVSALEVHGPHLPVGMDLFMARWMAEETARRFSETHPDWTVVLLPHLPVGTDELPLPGSVNVKPHTFYRLLWDQVRSLVEAGYRYIVLTNGHGGPRHAAAIENVCRRMSRRYGVSVFSPSILALHRIISGQRFAEVEAVLGRALSAEEREGLLAGEHAGGWETAFQLAADVKTVEPTWQSLQRDEPPKWGPLVRFGEWWIARRECKGLSGEKLREMIGGLAGSIGWLLNARYGYAGPAVTYKGTPAVASAELGRAFREVMVRDCLEIVEQVTGGSLPAESVRSIASDHTVIQPLFFRRVGLAALAVLLGLLLLVKA